METDSHIQTERQSWMAILAKANWQDLKRLWDEAPNKPVCQPMRNPEAGLVMVRGRMGGVGRAFNFGEASVTRCTVESAAGTTGHAYVLGRNKQHALVAAQIDAGLQDERIRESLLDCIIEPLEKKRQAALVKHRRKVAATKVDFFTVVRGEDD